MGKFLSLEKNCKVENMKTAIILLVVVYMATQAASEAVGVGKKPFMLPKFHKLLSLSRTRRQTGDENPTTCSTIAARVACTSSYTQNYINAVSKCGEMAVSITNFLEYSCRKNSKGQYCTEVYSTNYVSGNCSGGTSSCHSGCSKALMDGGCCLNDGTGTYDDFFTACRMSLPTQCEKSRLKIPTNTEDDSCSSSDDLTRVAHIADCDNSQPIINAWDREGTCKDSSDFVRDVCASRNGQYCWVELNITGSGNGDSVGIRSLAAAAANCPSTSTCSSACSSSLTAVVNTVGCCFQFINNSNIYTPNFETTIFSSRLWNICNIPLVSPCGAPPMHALYISFVFLLANIMMLLHI